MLTMIKLGGSLITDKRVAESFRADVMARLAEEIAAALKAQPDLKLILGHGSGSFGHFAAKEHDTINGVHTPEQWHGFAQVATVAAELNYLVGQALKAVAIPVWRIQPSASARCEDGQLVEMALHPVQKALEHNIVPLVYGDVALDNVRGGTIISTETIMGYLATHLPIKRILLLGEVEGVYDTNGAVIPEITPDNVDTYRQALGGSEGTDVTGGMLTKVQDMLQLVENNPTLQIRIMDGTKAGLLKQTLLGETKPGTLIRQ